MSEASRRPIAVKGKEAVRVFALPGSGSAAALNPPKQASEPCHVRFNAQPPDSYFVCATKTPFQSAPGGLRSSPSIRVSYMS